MTAVGIMLPLNGGDVDLVLYLYNKGVLLNAGGDALVEVGTSDYFEADVSEALVTTYQAVVFDGVGDAIYQGTLYAGETVVDQVPVAGSALGSHLGAAQRSVGSTTPIEFPWDAPDLETITGTLGDGTTAIEGEISFLRTEGGRHMYRITYNADDWPSGAGTLGYILTDGTTVRTLDLVVGAGAGGGGDATEAKQDQILGKFASTPLISQPVSTTGQITEPIVIGDDYKAENGREFEWTVDEVPGFVASNAECHFGAENSDGEKFNVEGTVTDNSDGTWNLSFDLLASDTASLSEGYYKWSVAVSHDGVEITRVRVKYKCTGVQLVKKQATAN